MRIVALILILACVVLVGGAIATVLGVGAEDIKTTRDQPGMGLGAGLPTQERLTSGAPSMTPILEQDLFLSRLLAHTLEKQQTKMTCLLKQEPLAGLLRTLRDFLFQLSSLQLGVNLKME